MLFFSLTTTITYSTTLHLTRNRLYCCWFTHTPVISLDLNGQNCRTLNLANWPWLWSKRVQPSGVHTAERFCSVPSPTEEEEVSAGSSYSLCAKLLSSPSVVGNLQHHRTISSTTLRADWSISSWTNERQRRARACCSASSLTISSPYRYTPIAWS